MPWYWRAQVDESLCCVVSLAATFMYVHIHYMTRHWVFRSHLKQAFLMQCFFCSLLCFSHPSVRCARLGSFESLQMTRHFVAQWSPLGRDAFSSTPLVPSLRASSSKTAFGSIPMDAQRTKRWKSKSADSFTTPSALLAAASMHTSTPSSPTFCAHLSGPLANKREVQERLVSGLACLLVIASHKRSSLRKLDSSVSSWHCKVCEVSHAFGSEASEVCRLWAAKVAKPDPQAAAITNLEVCMMQHTNTISPLKQCHLEVLGSEPGGFHEFTSF